jgi:hypothetical protein
VIEARAGRRLQLWDARPWLRLTAALAASGAVHAAVIALGRADLPPEPADLPPLAVRLTNVGPPPAAPAKSVRLPLPRSRLAPAAAARVPGLISSASVAQTDEALPAAEETAAPETLAAAPAEPVVVATAPVASYTPEAPPLPAFPRTGRIAFTLVYGRDHFPVGRTVQSWKIDGTRYQLASRSETTGIVDVFRSQHRTYLSRGELTPEGLRPETFLASRDRGRGLEEARAQFDWPRGSVRLGAATSQREQSLPRGSQDIVSFVYQLALDPPPPGRTRVSVTNGSRLENYELEVLPEEKIETPLGVLRALPIRQVRTKGAESVELWLATEYRHLPVRIRFYGRDGEPTGEQIVTEIRLSDE